VTALTALPGAAAMNRDGVVPPLPWRRMTWVTWRQHRVALSGVAAFLGLVAVYVWLTGLQLHHAYDAALACRPASSLTCGESSSNFKGIGQILANGFLLQAVPALIGAFIGAPLLSRELETGTFRFAWTQGFGRWRWTLAKLVMLALAVSVAAGAISMLFSWYYQPYFAAANQALNLAQSPSLTPGLFDLRGITFAAWTLAAFAIGGLAGMVIRRVVPSIVATLAVYAGLAAGTGGLLRQHYLAPVVTRSLNIPGTAWVLSAQWFDRHGRPVNQFLLGQVLQHGDPQLAGKGGVPKSFSTWQYLLHHGYTQLTTYQPASRFWPFQWIEGGWLLALSVALIAATVLLVRRRAI